MLNKFEINARYNPKIQTKNTASVLVIATISRLNYIGQKINIIISSIGNAKNLNDGILLMTPLQDIHKKLM